MVPSRHKGFGYLLLALIAIGFTVAFAGVVVPALVRDNWNVAAGLAQGFVNPYASGYSLDVISCWLVLAVWIAIERKEFGIRRGWICLVLGLVPGVATGLAVYLLLRQRHFAHHR